MIHYQTHVFSEYTNAIYIISLDSIAILFAYDTDLLLCLARNPWDRAIMMSQIFLPGLKQKIIDLNKTQFMIFHRIKYAWKSKHKDR